MDNLNFISEKYTPRYGYCVGGPANGLRVEVPPSAGKSALVEVAVPGGMLPSYRTYGAPVPQPRYAVNRLQYMLSYRFGPEGWPDAPEELKQSGGSPEAGMWALVPVVDVEAEQYAEQMPDCGWCGRCSDCCDEDGRPLPRRSDGRPSRYPDEPVPYRGMDRHPRSMEEAIRRLERIDPGLTRIQKAFPGVSGAAGSLSGMEDWEIEFKIKDVSPDLHKLLFGEWNDSDHGD